MSAISFKEVCKVNMSAFDLVKSKSPKLGWIF